MMQLNQQKKSLSAAEMSSLKGGYIYSCEEKKRHMEITCFTDEGKKINAFKIAPGYAMRFMATFNGNKNFKIEDEE